MLNDRGNRLDYGLFGLLNLCWLLFPDRRDRLGPRLHRHRLLNRLTRLDHLADFTLHNRRHLAGLHFLRDHLGLTGGGGCRTRSRLRRLLGWLDFSLTCFLNPLWFDQCDVPREHLFSALLV